MDRVIHGNYVIEINGADEFYAFMDLCARENIIWIKFMFAISTVNIVCYINSIFHIKYLLTSLYNNFIFCKVITLNRQDKRMSF